MATSEIVYHRDRGFSALPSTPYCMDSLGYELYCPKCDRAVNGISRKRSKSECADNSKWKSNSLVMSEPRMLRSSNRPLLTNSNTLNSKTEVQRVNKLCNDCDDSKNNSYSAEMEELRRQLRQVGRNHYSGSLRGSLPNENVRSREYSLTSNSDGYNSYNRSSTRQLRPRRFLLPKIPVASGFVQFNGNLQKSAQEDLNSSTNSLDQNFESESTPRVLRNKTYRDSQSSSNGGSSFGDTIRKSSLKNGFDIAYPSTPSPNVSEKRTRPQKKFVPPTKIKCKPELKKSKSLQDEGMDLETEPVHTSPSSSKTIPLSAKEDIVMEVESAVSNRNEFQPVKELTILHPGLRLSLFSNMPPYIKFVGHDDQAQTFPTQVTKHLKWRLSPITPVVVRKTIVNSGFRLVRKSSEWCGTWGKHMKSLSFRTLKESQKINHFPGTFQIGRKDRLWKNLLKCMMKYGDKEFGFTPRTFVLPGDDKLLRASWEKNCGNIKWIVKPPASARGVGIKVVHKWNQIPRKMPLVVQKYLDDPYLINDTKFDLRLYVLVTSFNPLRIYLFDNGLVRFASVKYSANSETLQDRYMHLTNYSINKLSASYTQNEDAEACQGHKWTLKTLWTHLEKERNVDVVALQDSIVDVVIKTMICGEHSISQLTRTNQQSRYSSYELFGIDILLDSKLKPWLLEVNISPSLHSSSPLDLAVKGPLVQDLFNIVGFHLPEKIPRQHQEELCGITHLNILYDKRLYTPLLSNEEREKHVNFVQNDAREEYLHTIAQSLTPDDVRHLIIYEDELTQLGSFIKVFPTTTSHRYFQFFEGPRYYNMLFDAWEYAHHSDRSKGIKILEDKCIRGVHLDISQVNLRPTQTSPIPQSEEPSPTSELEPDVVRSTSKISLSCSANLCRPHKVSRPRLRTYVTRRTSRRCSKSSSS